jgi:hypothetical protein
MSPTTTLSIESADAPLNEKDRIFLWRCEELRRAGYGPEAADLLAANPDIDLDLAVALRARRLRAA